VNDPFDALENTQKDFLALSEGYLLAIRMEEFFLREHGDTEFGARN